MPASGFSSGIDLGLPDNPDGISDELYDNMTALFNAIKILHQAVTALTGNSTTDATNFLAVTQPFSATLQGQRMMAIQVQASENITAGSMINLWNNSGLKVRNALAGNISTRAHGYCDIAIGIGQVGIVYLWFGYLNGVSAVPGQTYYLSNTTPGALSTVAPIAVGTIRQEVAVGLSISDVAVKISTPIIN